MTTMARAVLRRYLNPYAMRGLGARRLAAFLRSHVAGRQSRIRVCSWDTLVRCNASRMCHRSKRIVALFRAWCNQASSVKPPHRSPKRARSPQAGHAN